MVFFVWKRSSFPLTIFLCSLPHQHSIVLHSNLPLTPPLSSPLSSTSPHRYSIFTLFLRCSPSITPRKSETKRNRVIRTETFTKFSPFSFPSTLRGPFFEVHSKLDRFTRNQSILHDIDRDNHFVPLDVDLIFQCHAPISHARNSMCSRYF